MASSTVLPSRAAALADSRSAAPASLTALTILSARAMNSSFLATKSVSLLSSIMTPPSAAIRPSAVDRSARLPTSLAPLIRRASTALSKLPSFSSSAFLQSNMPAPVTSRRRLTSAALMFAIVRYPSSFVRSVEVVEGWRGPSPGGARAGETSGGGRTASVASNQPECPVPHRWPARTGDPTSGLGLSGLAGLLPRGGLSGLPGQQFLLPLGQRLAAGRLLLALSSTVGAAAAGHQTFRDTVGDHAGQQRSRADGVVVARDRVVDLVRVAVGVQDGDHRDAQLASLADGDVLLLGVHDPHGAGHLVHVADTAERLL